MAKAVILPDNKRSLKSVKPSNYFMSKILFRFGKAKINYSVPFKVKFTNIGIEAYGRGNAAPIGIAVIGVNNYVM
jgi:hypothetical protein